MPSRREGGVSSLGFKICGGITGNTNRFFLRISGMLTKDRLVWKEFTIYFLRLPLFLLLPRGLQGICSDHTTHRSQ